MGAHTCHTERLSIVPVCSWVQARLADPETDTVELAAECGVSQKIIYRWRHQIDDIGRPAFTVPRGTVEDALHRAGLLLWDLYPWTAAEPVEVREAWCDSCHERSLTDEDGACLWCETPTRQPEAVAA